LTDGSKTYDKTLVNKRIKLIFIDDRFTILKSGDCGIVRDVVTVGSDDNSFQQILIDWDNGNKLPYLIPDKDTFQIL